MTAPVAVAAGWLSLAYLKLNTWKLSDEIRVENWSDTGYRFQKGFQCKGMWRVPFKATIVLVPGHLIYNAALALGRSDAVSKSQVQTYCVDSTSF